MSPPIPRGNFYAAFARTVDARPDAPCIELDGRHTLTRADLHRLAQAYAARLTQLGCRQGDRVAAQLDKSEHSLAVYLACLHAGLVYVPMNTAYQAAELAHLLRDASPRAVLCTPGKEGVLRPLAGDGAGVRTLDTDGNGTFTAVTVEGIAPMVPLDAEQPAALLYTSGTTGKPKGALISHRAMWHSAQAIAGCWRFSEDDVLLHALPLFHGHGLFVSSNVALASGARMIFLPKFVASAVIDCLPRSTVFMAVPTFYNRLLNEPGFSRQACARIRLLTSGSAPLPARTHQEIARRTGHQVVERYGATEAMVLCSNPVDGERRPGSVGKPLPGVEIRIADAHDAPLAAGAIGMVQARGPGLFSGYWRNAAQTAAEITADGFFRTGDLGWLSPDGYLTITGRQKDVVISGGYNVYPAEVEAALAEIEGVCEAAVVGVPHPDFGEAVVAFLVPHGRPGLPEGGAIVSALRTRLANYKLPKELYVLPELPRNVMGKVLKTSLRGLAAEGQAQRIH